MAGDMHGWFKIVGPISGDFTIMEPFGGESSRGFDGAPERLDQMSRYFRGGKATLDVVESYASRDLMVLAFVERQTGQVGDLPGQDWSLRVTQVYRRRGRDWELVHRYADPLVRRCDLNTTAALARGAPQCPG